MVDNVSDYYYQQGEQGMIPTDFPNCAPPFPLFWMESRRPQCTLQKPFLSLGYAWGFLFCGIELNDLSLDQRQEFLEAHFPLHDNDFHVVSNISKARWVYKIVGFLQKFPHDPISPLRVQAFFLLQETGEFIKAIDTAGQEGPYATFSPLLLDDSTEWKHTMPLAGDLLLPFWLAISFLHCKNVATTLIDPCHPQGKKKASMKCRRAHYHLLNIHPMREVLRTEGQQEQTGLEQALHICRGHFRDYSTGRGLFGKHKGIYWFEQHLRGSSEHGVIVKDYNIHPQ